jgi:hypothetical protein
LNILADDLPEAIEIEGVEYPIFSDFKPCLRTILAFEDDQLTGVEKQEVMLTNLYKEMPTNIQAASEMGVKFLNGGEASNEGESQGLRLYSLTKDANFIFAAFKQTHNVDLQKEEMHWWKFLALFMDLGGETTFCGNILPIRDAVKRGTATKEQKEAYRDHPEIYELPEKDDRTPEEKQIDEEFLSLLPKGSE